MDEEPKGMQYWYIDDQEHWAIRDDAPEWAKTEFKEYFSDLPDEDGIVRTV